MKPNTGSATVDAALLGRRLRLCLRIGGIGELERRAGRGIGAIIGQIARRQGGAVEIIETLRLGLVGGGMCPKDADAIVDAQGSRPLMETAAIAAKILAGAVSGLKSTGGKSTELPQPGDLSIFYSAGAVIGWTPRDVDQLTLAEFAVAVDGYIAAHGGKEEIDISEQEYALVLAEEMAAGRA